MIPAVKPTVTYGGVDHRGNKLAKTFTYVSRSTPGKKYETLVYPDGSLTCNCPGWTQRKKANPDGTRICAHTQLTEQILLMADSGALDELLGKEVAAEVRRVGVLSKEVVETARRRFNFTE